VGLMPKQSRSSKTGDVVLRSGLTIWQAELAYIPSIWGHLAAFGVNPPDDEFIDAALRELLAA